MMVARGIDADTVVEVLEWLVAERGGAGTAAVRQRPGDDRARAQGLVRAVRTGTAFIEPDSPWQNPFVESFRSLS